MSLRDSYFDGPTGLNAKMDDAFAAGQAYVVANNTALATAMTGAAAQGQLQFSAIITGTGSMNAGYLRANNGNNLLLKSFFAGIVDGLAAEEIYSYQVSLKLDVSDSVNTNVIFCFNFGGNTITGSSCGCSSSSGSLLSSVGAASSSPKSPCF